MFFREKIYGPIVEELIYRGIIFNILNRNINNYFISSLMSSILFGLSHIRHLFEKDYHDFKADYNQIINQVKFTSLFALYSSLINFITNSIFGSIYLHMQCNYLGMPDFSYRKYLRNNKLIKGKLYLLFNI